MPAHSRELVVGSRGSALARWQMDWVVSRLRQAWPTLNIRVEYFTTAGDRITERPLPEFGQKGVFTDDLAQALLTQKIDIAVHSLKDLPVVDETPGLQVAALGERADARDVLIAARPLTLQTLPPNARVGTSSLRRSAQLLAARPDLTILPVRGNVDTRIRKTLNGEYDAVVLAAAGLARLEMTENIVEYLPFDVMLPAPGQGALAIQCRADDSFVSDTLQSIDHLPTRQAVTTERAFLQALGGGCSAPIAAYATADGKAGLQLNGLVAAVDGSHIIRVSGVGSDALQLGTQLGQQALALGAGVLLP